MQITDFKRKRTRAVLAGVTAVVVSQTPAMADTGLTHRLDNVIDRWVSSERIVGVTAIVAQDGDVLYHHNAGFADREARRPVTDDTIFRLASMTKLVTCATALALVEEGRLSLDDTVADWLPYFTPALPDGQRPEITLRQLMSHTSGLSYPFFEELAVAYRDGPDRAEILPEGGMIPVGASISTARALDPSAWPSGGGGMSGTASDYLRFVEAIRGGGAPILSPASAELLTTHQIGDLRALSEEPGWGHGLGAAVLVDPEAAGTPQNPGTWQWGGVLGTHWFVDPDRNLTVLVLTNTSVAGVIGEFPIEIRDAVYGQNAGDDGEAVGN